MSDTTNTTGASTDSKPPKESGLEVIIVRLVTWLAAFAAAPLLILATDSSRAVRKRRAAGAQDLPSKTAAIFYGFPLLLLFVSIQGVVPSLVYLVLAPLTWLAVAKRVPARYGYDLSIKQVVSGALKAPLAMKVITGLAVLAAGIATFAGEDGGLPGWILVMVGYPIAVSIGKARVNAGADKEASEASDRRTIGLVLGLSEAQAEALEVYRTGTEEAGDLRVNTGELPLDVISKLAGVEDAIATHAPGFEVISASAEGVVIGLASEETIQRREQLRSSGGLIAGISEAPTAGSDTPTFGFSSDGISADKNF